MHIIRLWLIAIGFFAGLDLEKSILRLNPVGSITLAYVVCFPRTKNAPVSNRPLQNYL